jgi:hypothetical protein
VLGEIVASFTEDSEDLKRVFDFLMEYLSNKSYGFSRFKENILEMFVPLCGIGYIREAVEKMLKGFEGQTTERYRRKELQELQYAIISQFDDEEATQEFADSHLDNDNFRVAAIERAIAQKDYGKALELCLDGGIWEQLRYRIYEESGDISGQKKLAYHFTVAGSFEYYLKLRKLYGEDSEDSGQWYQVFDDILAAVLNPYPKRIYTEILVHENMKPELLEYCRQRLDAVVEYYPHLLPDYADEVDEIFTELIVKTAAQADSRSNYKAVCTLIKKYAAACGKDGAAELIREFKAQYVKRPAFIDELGKVKI